MKKLAREEYDAIQATVIPPPTVTNGVPLVSPTPIPILPVIVDNTNNIAVIEYYLSSPSSIPSTILAKCASTNTLLLLSSTRHMILDSGAIMHMPGNTSLFTSFVLFPSDQAHAFILADGTPQLQASGIGMISITLCLDLHIHLHDTIFVLGLRNILYSIKRHIIYIGCAIPSENSIIWLSFPTLHISTIMNPEVSVDNIPNPIRFQSFISPPHYTFASINSSIII